MNLTALRAELLARGSNYIDASGTTRQDYFINRSYQRICERQAWPFLIRQATGTSPLTIADLRAVLSVVDSTNRLSLQGMDRRTLRDSDPTLIATGTPWAWYVSDDTLIAYPTSADSLLVNYVRVPIELEDGTDTPLIPDRYHYVIVDGAMAALYRDTDNFDAAGAADLEYERGIAEMADSLLNVDYGEGSYMVLTSSSDW